MLAARNVMQHIFRAMEAQLLTPSNVLLTFCLHLSYTSCRCTYNGMTTRTCNALLPSRHPLYTLVYQTLCRVWYTVALLKLMYLKILVVWEFFAELPPRSQLVLWRCGLGWCCASTMRAEETAQLPGIEHMVVRPGPSSRWL